MTPQWSNLHHTSKLLSLEFWMSNGHSNIGLPLHEGKAPKYSWSKTYFLKHHVFPKYSHAFFQSSLHLRPLFDNILQKFCKSLKNYKYEDVTPSLQASFGAASIGMEDSGVGALFHVRGPGRPPKNQQAIPSSIFQNPLCRPSRLLSSTNAQQPITHIHFIAKDMTDDQFYVFVEWSEKKSPAGSWIPLSSLTPATRKWFDWEWSSRFPSLDVKTCAPTIRCTSSLVTLIVDDSSDVDDSVLQFRSSSSSSSSSSS